MTASGWRHKRWLGLALFLIGVLAVAAYAFTPTYLTHLTDRGAQPESQQRR